MRSDGYICLIVAKLVNDLLVTGEEEVFNKFIAEFINRFILGAVSHGPLVCDF